MAITNGIVAFGSCYLDINVPNYPFSDTGILSDTELIGGSYELAAGGSAVIFCRTVQGLGVQTMFVGLRGHDLFGQTVEDLITQSGVTAHFGLVSSASTNISYNMTNNTGKHIMLLAGTANQHLSAATLMPILKDELKDVQMLYVGGAYKHAGLQQSFDEIVEAAKNADTKIVVDHGRVPAAVSPSMIESVKKLVNAADYYFPSHDEFLKTWHVGDIAEGLQLLKHQAPQLTVVVKNGDDGAYFIEDGQVAHIDAVRVEAVADLTGAGDTFNAGVIAGVIKGDTLRQAVQSGCMLAAKKISKGGVV